MDPVIAPLATGILMALGATGLPENGFGTVAGLLGNWAANGIQGGAVGLLHRITDNSVDRDTGLPRNHDLQLASCDALRGAATALLLEAAGRLQPRKPWVPALREFLNRERWRKEPLLNALDRPDLNELAGLRQAISSDRFRHWHDGLSLSEAELRSCFQGGRCNLRAVLPQRFETWLHRQLKVEELPQAVLTPLREGWSPGGGSAATLRFEDIYCLHFREALKQRPEVFRILMADALMGLDEAVARIEAGMNDHVDMARSLLEGQSELLAQMRGGQRELRDSLQDTISVLGVLQCEVQAGNQEAAKALSDVHFDVQRLEAAFGELQRQLFGLTLLRPEATRPPALGSDQGDLWLIQAKYRALPLAGRADIQEALWQWLHAPATISVRLLVGDAGAGKTRLGMELVWRLAAEEGECWHAGFVASADVRQLAGNATPARLQWHQPTLVVVDYARAATDGLKALLEELARRSNQAGQPKLRLLLLERRASATKDWLDDLMAVESSHGGRPANELFDPQAAELLPPLDVQGGRRHLFSQALQVLATRGGQPPLLVPAAGELPAFDAMLQRGDWGDPLVPVMSALVAHKERDIMRAGALSRTDLAEKVAALEKSRLLTFANSIGTASQARLFTHIAAISVLCGGLRRAEALEVSERESGATKWTWNAGIGSLVDQLCAALASEDAGVSSLTPDLVAEAFVLGALVGEHLPPPADTAAIVRAVPNHEPPVVGLIVRAAQSDWRDRRRPLALARWYRELHRAGFVDKAIEHYDELAKLRPEVASTFKMLVQVRESFDQNSSNLQVSTAV